ncbi:DMP19 family protein [Bailinhaonella thermotolerans]|uniref:DUF4375 domain-containing protein n=1 Tax=Bailinhaonella thermotolerans TaxID=1070861 RepID=A0A3A4A911_9ACTN|nr:DUF4375 domain-containing protein [Bailinhaonella thermotolerans]RJL21742.1 DUF4375 domain-containing protein [Bailinhaonella thermotolerans]
MTDPQTRILDLVVLLAEKEGAGGRLSPAERVVADIGWIDAMVAPNGFDGWLAYTSCEQMTRTLHALGLTGDDRLLALVREALDVAGIDPAAMSDEERDDRLGDLPDDAHELLSPLDDRYYGVVGDTMARCLAFAEANGIPVPSGEE